jgi:hypothetical protein
MTVLTDFRGRIRQVLADENAVRYDDNTVDEALRLALAEYNPYFPNITCAEMAVDSSGRELSLAGLPGLLDVIEVIYPIPDAQHLPLPMDCFWVSWTDGAVVLYLGGTYEPQVGDRLRLVYSAANTVTGLDAASLTSVRSDHEGLLVIGAAGHAAVIRAGGISESYGSQAAEHGQLLEWGSTRLSYFHNLLKELRAPAHRYQGPLPAAGWRIDRWDGVGAR